MWGQCWNDFNKCISRHFSQMSEKAEGWWGHVRSNDRNDILSVTIYWLACIPTLYFPQHKLKSHMLRTRNQSAFSPHSTELSTNTWYKPSLFPKIIMAAVNDTQVAKWKAYFDPKMFPGNLNIDRRKCKRTVPMQVLSLGLSRTGTACKYSRPNLVPSVSRIWLRRV